MVAADGTTAFSVVKLKDTEDKIYKIDAHKVMATVASLSLCLSLLHGNVKHDDDAVG